MTQYEPGPQGSAQADVLVRYEQICADIRFTDELSLKLLGFVPLVTGAGIFVVLLGGSDRSWWQAAVLGGFVGVLGAIVTFAIYRWELRNVEFCRYLRTRAAYIEKHGALDDRHGHYHGRPDAPIWPPWMKIEYREEPSWIEDKPTKEKPRGLGKTEAERILYTAVIVSWLALPAVAAVLA